MNERTNERHDEKTQSRLFIWFVSALASNISIYTRAPPRPSIFFGSFIPRAFGIVRRGSDRKVNARHCSSTYQQHTRRTGVREFGSSGAWLLGCSVAGCSAVRPHDRVHMIALAPAWPLHVARRARPCRLCHLRSAAFTNGPRFATFILLSLTVLS